MDGDYHEDRASPAASVGIIALLSALSWAALITIVIGLALPLL